MTHPDARDRWADFFAEAEIAAALNSDEDGVFGLWLPLGKAARDREGADAELLQALAKVSALELDADNWHTPYGASVRTDNRRAPTVADLETAEADLLRAAAPAIPNTYLRARVYDVLFLLAEGKVKVEYAQQHVAALLRAPVTEHAWWSEHDAWDRALTVARRFGAATAQQATDLEAALRSLVSTSSDGYVPLRAAELLSKHGLAADIATTLGERLEHLSEVAPDREHTRIFLAGAAHWFEKAGDQDHAAHLAVLEIRNFITEAEEQLGDERPIAMRAAYFYELALRRLRQVPRTQRTRLGVDTLAREIALRIRELGVASLGEMHAFEFPTINLNELARQVREHIADSSLDDALMRYCSLMPWLSKENEQRLANEQLTNRPILDLLSNVHYSIDGRVTYRSSRQADDPIYGVHPNTWDRMARNYDRHVSIVAVGMLYPGWIELTNQHHFSLDHFHIIARYTSIVPPAHEQQFARALYYGYNGDFSTALQLLAPQIEALVRYHFVNAGEPTSTIDPESQTETELGLSALMQRDAADEILTSDLAFEIRMLFCGPLGMNLRNDVAHGLLLDSAASSHRALYAWWFGLRLTFLSFWNSQYDAERAEAREPQMPNRDGEDVDDAFDD